MSIKEKLNIQDGKVVLMHDSTTMIRNGVIKASNPQNAYSKNSDTGAFFWGREVRGIDNSNYNDTYTYYCLVDIDDVYDMETNEKGYESYRQALENEPYVAVKWNRPDGAVAVNTLRDTRIDYVFVKTGNNQLISGIYRPQWKLLRSCVFFYDNNKNQKILNKINPEESMKSPSWLPGYNRSQFKQKMQQQTLNEIEKKVKILRENAGLK